MCSDIDESLQNLFLWVKEFDYVDASLKPSDLADGIIISKILCDVSPAFFPLSWQSSINLDASRLLSDKVFNLNHILGGISQFFIESIGQPLEPYELPDVALIAEQNDACELFRLLQLVICCAVKGENKALYIEAILNMEQSVQHAIMEAIQNVMSERKSSCEKSIYQTEEDLRQHCLKLESRIAELEEREKQLEGRKAPLLDEAGTMLDAVDDNELSSEPGLLAAQLRIRQLKQKVTSLTEELFHAESEHQETKLKLTEATSKIDELKKAIESLSLRAEDANRMKDELDECREALHATNQLVASVELWKRRSEETNALRLRCNKLELDNAAALQRLDELEQENRLQSNRRTKAEISKQQSAEVASLATTLQTRVEQAESELKRVQAELKTSLHEKETLLGEFNRLRERYDQSMSSEERLSGISKNSIGDAVTPNTSLQPLDVSLENASHVLHLDSSSPALILSEPVHSSPVEREDGISSANEDKETGGKAVDVYEIEQRYRGYLAKALQLIRQLDRKLAAPAAVSTSAGDQQQHTDAEISRLQNLLIEKENIIEQLERHHEESRRQRDLEERIVLTAWYHLGMRVNRAGADSRLRGGNGTSGSDTSFLARQRQLHLQSTPPPSGRIREP